MNESNTFAVLALGLLAGMLIAFGLVMVFEFLAKPDDTCQASLYVRVKDFTGNL